MLEILKERLRMYLDAEKAVLSGQSYTIGDRQLQRPDLKYIQQQISDLIAEINTLELKKGRTKRTVFID